MRSLSLPRTRLAFAALAASLLAVSGVLAATAEKIPGQSASGLDRHVESIAGNLPIVLTAPHGGRLRPDAIPNRTEGVTDMDANTQELARAVAAEFFARTGRHVALVASQLHRIKLDPNRELKEAAQGSAIAERAWREYHAAIEAALAAAVARHGFAFLVDLHGHAHPIARLELGYALDAKQLNQTDAALDAAGLVAVSTLRDLHARRGGSAADLLRGPRSLGAFFAERGFRAVPSPTEPRPGDGPFFSGGYTVRRHCAEPATTKIDGLQIECHRAGVRDTAENRTRFAQVAAESLLLFLRERYAFDLAGKK